MFYAFFGFSIDAHLVSFCCQHWIFVTKNSYCVFKLRFKLTKRRRVINSCLSGKTVAAEVLIVSRIEHSHHHSSHASYIKKKLPTFIGKVKLSLLSHGDISLKYWKFLTAYRDWITFASNIMDTTRDSTKHINGTYRLWFVEPSIKHIGCYTAGLRLVQLPSTTSQCEGSV